MHSSLWNSSDVILTLSGRFQYLLTSHFLLNLQDVVTVTVDDSQSSFICSDQGQVSSIRFVDSIIGNLGESLHDGSHEDDEEEDVDSDMGDAGILEIARDDEEMQAGLSLQSVDV